jgi:hypothetical protein
MWRMKEPMKRISRKARFAVGPSGNPRFAAGSIMEFVARKTAPMNNATSRPFKPSVKRLQWAGVCCCKDVVKSLELGGYECMAFE